MIQNIPEWENLEKASLLLYFRAWTEIVSWMQEFGPGIEDLYARENDRSPGQQAMIEAEQDEFLERSKPDLQIIYTLIQQSQELALKAKVCRVSPYALLIGANPREFSKSDRDFADFRTVDAADLPDLVDSLCETALQEQFRQLYNKVRRNRNKIYHLAWFGDELEPREFLNLLIDHYTYLYPERAWASARLNYARSHRLAQFHGKHYNEYTEVLDEFSFLEEQLDGAQFRRLFGVKKSGRRYLCYNCHSSARDLNHQGIRTAIVKPNKMQTTCFYCQQILDVNNESCSQQDCPGEYLAPDEFLSMMCLTCGYNNESDPMTFVVSKLSKWASTKPFIGSLYIGGDRLKSTFNPQSPLLIQITHFEPFSEARNLTSAEEPRIITEISEQLSIPTKVSFVKPNGGTYRPNQSQGPWKQVNFRKTL